MSILRVGILGASVNPSWAHFSHIPALHALPNVELAAVATSRAETAQAAAAAHGARHAFVGAKALAESPDVDLVVVSVRAPNHAEGVEAALAAGKAVWCEWPMGPGGERSSGWAKTARERGIPTIVGLQGRFAPAAAYARELIAEGYIGRLMSVSVQAEFSYWGENITAGYSAEMAANASVLSITGGHILDMLTFVAGDVESVSGTLSYQRESGFALDQQERVKMTAPDQFAASGTLVGGAVFSAHMLGAAPRGDSFQLIITGSAGQLRLEAPGMPEMVPLTLRGFKEGEELHTLEIPAKFHLAPKGMVGPAENIAAAYSQLPADLSTGTGPLPDFDHGVKMQRLLDAIRISSETGMRQTLV